MGLLLLLLPASSLEAQAPAAPPKRVQEALILSGGGSRGLAHAGVLVGLERLGHDPDLVVGTSMGALVGALYAAGYPPEEIERQIDAVRWGEMFTAAPLLLGPEREVRYPLVSLDRETDPLRFNRGFIPQWRINRALAHLLFDANARSRGDFDRMARRFRAVAADLETGDTTVLARGDLARAVRASMAVPGIFAPIEWEERFLVDGGIADNLPIEVGREMGARRVIAVDVSRAPSEIQGRTPLQVAGRALDLLQDNAERGSVPPDVLILPKLPPNQQGITFPGDPHPLFRIGLEATREVAPVPEHARLPSRPIPAPPQEFGALKIEAPDPAFERMARAIFESIAPGPYDPERVLRAVDQLYTTGLFEAVWPRVDEDGPDAVPTLVIRLEAPPRTSFSGGLGYDSDRGGRGWGALQRGAVIFRSPTTLTAAASGNRLEQWAEVSARLHLPRYSLLSASTGLYYQERDVRQFGGAAMGADQEVKRVGLWAGGEAQHALSARMLAAGVKGEWVSVEGGEDGFVAGPFVRLAAQTPEPPLVGTPMEVEGDVRLGAFRYTRLAARGSYLRRFGPLWTAGVLGATGTWGKVPADALPALGDRHLVPGFRWGERQGRMRAVAGFDVAYPVLRSGHLRARLRTGAVADEVGILQDKDTWTTGVELGALWRTPFGSLGLAWGANTTGAGRFYLDLGPLF